MLVESAKTFLGKRFRRPWRNLQKTFTYRDRCHSVHCSMMFLSVKMWSIQPFPLLKPSCSSRSLRSTGSDRRFMTTFARILLGTDKSVMPRQLLYSDRAPCFGILMMMPWLQSSNIFLLIHIVSNIGCRTLAVLTASTLNSSGLRRSLSGVLWFRNLHLWRQWSLLASVVRFQCLGPLQLLVSRTPLLVLVCWGFSRNVRLIVLLGLSQRWEVALAYLVWGHSCCCCISHRPVWWFCRHSSSPPFALLPELALSVLRHQPSCPFEYSSWRACCSLSAPPCTSLVVWLNCCHLSSSSAGASPRYFSMCLVLSVLSSSLSSASPGSSCSFLWRCSSL